MATIFPPRSIGTGWRLQTAAETSAAGLFGDRLSLPSVPVESWLQVDLPCTVLDGLVRNGRLPEPYEGLNLKRLPGYRPVTQNAVRYQEEIHNFSDLPLPADSPFRSSWWYRRELELTEEERSLRVFLRLDGINYGANVWLNGRRLAGAGLIGGVQRRYELELPRAALAPLNCLAIEVFPPEPDDLAFTFADWNPLPPDKCMGIWQSVSLAFSGEVTLRNGHLRAELDEGLTRARLRYTTELQNRSASAWPCRVSLKLEDFVVKMELELGPFETRELSFDATEYPELELARPRLWWPYQLGASNLYEAEAALEVEGKPSDTEALRFGIRRLETRINEEGSLLFSVNGVDLLIRGAGWSPDLMLRQSRSRDEADLAYVKNMGLNAVRLEGNMADDEFFAICDREGILVLSGWICCSYWERWNFWKQEDFALAVASLRDQLKRLRMHPSLIAWLYGSDRCPPALLEQGYLDALAELAPGLPALSSATAASSALSGKTGVKMSGPYAYVPPSYWYDEALPGFASGFNTETGPDSSIMAYESLERALPADQLFVGSEAWNLHLGVGVFSTTALTDRAVELRYGPAADLRDHCRKARLIQYESWRAMFEAYGRHFPRGTGVIAWMLNNAWPNQVFHLYDWYLRPGGGFYGAQKACETLHLQYSYDDRSIWALNQSLETVSGLEALVRVFDLGLRELYAHTLPLELGPHSARELLRLEAYEPEGGLSFVDLTLRSPRGALSRNFYWLPARDDVFTDIHTFYHTALRSHADLSALSGLPKAELGLVSRFREEGGRILVEVELENRSATPCLLVEALVRERKTGTLVLPVLWEENMVTLLPGELRRLTGSFARDAHRLEDLVVETSAFN